MYVTSLVPKFNTETWLWFFVVACSHKGRCPVGGDPTLPSILNLNIPNNSNTFTYPIPLNNMQYEERFASRFDQYFIGDKPVSQANTVFPLNGAQNQGALRVPFIIVYRLYPGSMGYSSRRAHRECWSPSALTFPTRAHSS